MRVLQNVFNQYVFPISLRAFCSCVDDISAFLISLIPFSLHYLERYSRGVYRVYRYAACITRAIRASRRTSGLGTFDSDDTRHCVVVITHVSYCRVTVAFYEMPHFGHRPSNIEPWIEGCRVQFTSNFPLPWALMSMVQESSASSNDMLIIAYWRRGVIRGLS